VCPTENFLVPKGASGEIGSKSAGAPRYLGSSARLRGVRLLNGLAAVLPPGALTLHDTAAKAHCVSLSWMLGSLCRALCSESLVIMMAVPCC